MERSVYEQPRTEVDRILPQQGGFKVSKGKRKGAKRMRKGENKEQGDCFTNCIVRPISVYIVNACNCLNDCQYIYACIIIIRYECS
jgi:hypothetical protein